MKFKILIIFLCLALLCSCTKSNVSYTFSENESINLNIGTSTVAEVISLQAETFDGNTVNDTSRPTNSYLPAGTVDYCSDTVITHTGSGKSYRLLKSGKRVYESDIKVYEKKLPETNRLIPYDISSDGKYTCILFETDFKAPFTLDLKEQTYYNEATQDYRINSPEYSYIEIEFKYCTEFLGDLDFTGNKIFKDCQVIQNTNSAVLKLFLKNAGEFYGWYAEYTDDGMLAFYFLEPTRVYSADNEYGYALYDATIVIDAGHGGKDSGATNGTATESQFNLRLAQKLKNELKTIGVNVIMTRLSDTDINYIQRISTAYNAKADMIISIHRDSGSKNGFNAYYYNPYTFKAAEEISKATSMSNLYNTVHTVNWHYFFLSRISCCPSVLTENGFITDTNDLKNMSDPEFETDCAKAITKGIINYYLNASLNR